MAHRIEHSDAPGDIFRAVAENAGRLNGNESRSLDIVHELSNNADLVNVSFTYFDQHNFLFFHLEHCIILILVMFVHRLRTIFGSCRITWRCYNVISISFFRVTL